MSQVAIQLDKVLINILKNKTLTQFTAVEIKNAYIEQIPTTKNREASQRVHRTLNKLCKLEFLRKYSEDNKVYFSKTQSFDDSCLHPSKPRERALTSDRVCTNTNHLLQFKARLNQYQVDLLEKIGEAEEFKRLFTEFPETKALLHSQYMEARNLSSSIMGKIKAVESGIKTLEKKRYET
ncbi:hypothetical protein [Shewanella spartinae]|uniref:hypothetical protein n=1 Tax=Shewanella spartinae TaxID=2864205 RepID=UPI001C6610B1|nr:hypothetical protein [Shewanella spartinae]QYJ93642.1 hypothetical protein K0I31_19030 [Shewanella spartinae]